MKDFSEQDKYLKAKKRVEKIKGFYIHLLVYVFVNIFLTLVIFKNINSGDFHISMLSTAFFWGIGLAFHAYGVFGKNWFFTQDWEDRKIKEFMEKDKKEFWE